jgi:di/tricarboxylate transporter
MTPEIGTCLLILAVAIACFAWDRIPADVVAIGVMLALVLTGLLKPSEAFAGFASDTVMMILGLLIMTAGLVRTGVVEKAGHLIFDIAGRNPVLFLPVIMVSVAVVSAFMSNTAATAFFVPLVIGYASKIGTPASKFLLPLAFASILTSSVTLISTSTNIVVSELMTRHGQPAMGMFEMTPVGIPIAVLGILYVWLLGTRLIPERKPETTADDVGERKYQADVVVPSGSIVIGSSIGETRIAKNSGLTVVKLLRQQRPLSDQASNSNTPLEGGDELLIEGSRADLLKIKDIEGFEFKADVHLPDSNTEPEQLAIVEGVLLPNSPLIGETLSGLEFKYRYGLNVLAIHRAGNLPQKISRTRLRLGDVLLLQGTAENVKALEKGNLFNIFGGIDSSRLDLARAPLASAIFFLAILGATFNFASLPIAVLSGAFLMMLTRCVSPEEAYREVEWKAVILIGALLSLGVAMEATGTGRYLGALLINLVGQQSPYALLSCFFLLTIALTQPMSNQAAALVVLPVAMQTALQIGVNPRTFAMMVAVAASCSYLTPLEPSCLMVYGPGKYRFVDFFIVGLPLTVLIYLIAILMVPMIWPL